MTLDGWMTRTTDNSAGDNIPNPEIVALAVQFNDPDLLPKAKTKKTTMLLELGLNHLEVQKFTEEELFLFSKNHAFLEGFLVTTYCCNSG